LKKKQRPLKGINGKPNAISMNNVYYLPTCYEDKAFCYIVVFLQFSGAVNVMFSCRYKNYLTPLDKKKKSIFLLWIKRIYLWSNQYKTIKPFNIFLSLCYGYIGIYIIHGILIFLHFWGFGCLVFCNFKSTPRRLYFLILTFWIEMCIVSHL